MHRIASVVAGLFLAFVGTSATFAGTINVPADQPTIAAAISASVNGDVINIAAGTYNESNLNPDGKAITIQGTLNEDGTLATTIDAQQNARVFTINSGEGSGTVIQDLIITGGSANGFGGGITIRNNSSPIISGCTILNNSANRSGGGIYCHINSHPTISDCTITDNTANGDGADGRGGGIYCIEANPTISRCAIFDNSANESGGGIYCNESNPTISSSVICSNTPDQISGGYTDSGVCIEQTCNTCYEDADGDGVLDYLDQCPGHDDYADADGDGTADGCDAFPNDPNEWTDIDGDGVGDNGDPVWTLAPGDSIQEAIANADNGLVIELSAGTYYEFNLNPDGKAITIQGTLNEDGTLATTIDAQQNARVFTINSGEGSGTVIRDLVITGGSTSDFGGGIFCSSNTNPTISNCTITGNTANVEGGGICCRGSDPTIIDCTISDNVANNGGGIYCFNNTPTISGCTISGNTAIDNGGGINSYISYSTISDCTITDNAANNGGGISCGYSYSTISGCEISGNLAINEGGGIYIYRDSNVTISNCTITDNMVTIFNGSGGGIRSYNYQTTISSSVICSNTPDQIDGVYTDSGVCIEQICNTCYEDADADGVLDYLDQCPGYDDNADADGDGTADGCDTCPEDPLNSDTDSDGTLDCIDGCPEDPNKTEPGNCGCDLAETTTFGDLDCDGDYDIDDIYAGMDSFGIETGSGCEADANSDGTVDVLDLLKVIDGWGLCD